MKLPERAAIVGKMKTTAEAGSRRGMGAAKTAVTAGRAVLMTKTGQRVATGAMAGAAIGAALPFVTMAAGAMLGAGALVMIKSMKDTD